MIIRWGLILAIFASLVCVQETLAQRCPVVKLDCDRTSSCQWSAEGTCVSILPCVLEPTETSCQVNSRSCQWLPRESRCRAMERVSNVSPCSGLTSSICSILRTCYWSSTQNSCAQRPNIVLSVADDLGWYDIGFNNPRARTPVLNRLKDTGINLIRHYTSRFCAPTRAMLMTGRLPWKIGLQTDANLNPAQSVRCAAAKDATLLPQILQSSGGYRTHAFGKWHLGSYMKRVTPTQRGFNSYTGFYYGGIDSVPTGPQVKHFWEGRCSCSAPKSRSKKKTSPRVLCKIYSPRTKKTCANAANLVNETDAGIAPIDSTVIEEDLLDVFLAKQAANIIATTPRQTPLFFYMAWVAPHYPTWSTQRHMDALLGTTPKWGTDARFLKSCKIKERVGYLGMVLAMDEAHGVLVDALDRFDRFDNTIIIFLSDNGANMAHLTAPKGSCRYGFNYPLRGAKYSFWDGGIRTVAFISSQTLLHVSARGTVSDRLISAADWRRTLIEASGISSFEDAKDDGQNLWGVISGFPSSQYPMVPPKDELALQVWLETNRAVILFYFEGQLWKIIKGYPAAGSGSGAVFKPMKKYSLSAIERPGELPVNETWNATNFGVGKWFECNPSCLLNLDEDPQELVERSKLSPAALQHGMSLVKKYMAQGVRFSSSGHCEPGYYAGATFDATDSWAIDKAKACQAFVPWLADDASTKKVGCT